MATIRWPTSPNTAAAPGDEAIAHTHEGTTYRFASAANRDAFAKERRALRAGVRRLLRLGGEPRQYRAGRSQAWRVVDGRLYLNHSRSVHRTWEQDVPGNIRKGDANWPALKTRP